MVSPPCHRVLVFLNRESADFSLIYYIISLGEALFTEEKMVDKLVVAGTEHLSAHIAARFNSV